MVKATYTIEVCQNSTPSKGVEMLFIPCVGAIDDRMKMFVIPLGETPQTIHDRLCSLATLIVDGHSRDVAQLLRTLWRR